MAEAGILDFLHVTKGYGEHLVLSEANCHIPMQAFVALLGAGGAGKTTFVRLVLKDLHPESGTILFCQRDLRHVRGAELEAHRRHIGWIPQEPLFLRGRSLEDNLGLTLRLAGEPPESRLIKLGEMAERLGLLNYLQEPIEKLSPSLQQLASLGRAWIHRPWLILADDPLRSLDRSQAHLALSVLAEASQQGASVVMTLPEPPHLPLPRLQMLVLDEHQIHPWQF